MTSLRSADDPEDYALVARQAADLIAAYRRSLPDRPVGAPRSVDEIASDLGAELPARGTHPRDVVSRLATAVEGGLTSSAGPRFYGFVVGGTLPGAMAADMLAVGWDQNAFNAVLSPAAAAAEAVAGRWLKDLLGLPAGASVGFVTGAQGANTAGLAAGRHHVLSQAGWDVEERGLQAAPRVRVVASVERHATIDRSLRLLGLGNGAVVPVASDHNGAIDVRELSATLAALGDQRKDDECAPIVALQAGNVNTGACDDLRGAATVAHEHDAWVHVDGAFGLWAAASPTTRHLVDGIELADSWGCDGHKWLNVPYDSGFAFCSRPEVATIAMSHTAPYLTGSGHVTGMGDLTAESSRRARGFAVWAALSELGREGVAELIESSCAAARRLAEGLAAGGLEILNDVVLNQVLVGVGNDPGVADRVAAAIQRDGTCWVGATTWRGRRCLRVSVSGVGTRDSDVDLSVAAILRLARDGGAHA